MLPSLLHLVVDLDGSCVSTLLNVPVDSMVPRDYTLLIFTSNPAEGQRLLGLLVSQCVMDMVGELDRVLQPLHLCSERFLVCWRESILGLLRSIAGPWYVALDV